MEPGLGGGDCEGRRGGGWPSRRVPTRVVHAWLGCRPPTLTSRHLPAVSFLLDAARARWAPSPTPPSPPFISSHRKRKSSSCEAASLQPGRLPRGSGGSTPPPEAPPPGFPEHRSLPGPFSLQMAFICTRPLAPLGLSSVPTPAVFPPLPGELLFILQGPVRRLFPPGRLLEAAGRVLQRGCSQR